MKDKYLKYFLVMGTLAIWIIVIVRIASGFPGQIKSPEIKIKSQSYISIQDTDDITLQADYPDPFLPAEDTIVNNFPNPVSKPNTFNPNHDSSMSKPSFEFIKYMGLITAKSGKLKIAIVNFKGDDVMMREKDKIQGFTLKYIDKQKLMFELKGKSIKIYKNQDTALKSP